MDFHKSARTLAIVLVILAGLVLLVAVFGHPEPALHSYARHNRVAQARKLLENGSDVKVRGNNGRTALHLATTAEMADLLLSHGADPSAVSEMGFSPLRDCIARHCEPAVVRLLLEHGANPNVGDGSRGDTPLHVACFDGAREAVSLLLDSGADINVQNDHGYTPLHCARTPEMTELLLSRGADTIVKNRYGRTPSEQAISLGQRWKADMIEAFEAKKKDAKKGQT